jgi:protein-disulfide isomerase
MKLAIVAIAAAAVGAAPAVAARPAEAVRPAPGRDWARTVVATAAGGFRMGNPAAPVTLVEYGSLACPHCRHFEQTGFKPLVQAYVRTGKVSYEFRSLLINGPDIAVTLLTRCAGAAGFFALADQVYAAQPQWEQRIADMTDADRAALEGMTDQQRIARFAEVTGLLPMAARAGVTPPRARQCLADRRALQKLLDIAQSAAAQDIRRTPTFLINGKPAEAATWEQLEPLLRHARRLTERAAAVADRPWRGAISGAHEVARSRWTSGPHARVATPKSVEPEGKPA